ncbi:hypothetical protein J3A83DRAFT_2898712 [Scleroderma citrinum]
MTEEFIEDLLTRLLDWVIDTYRSYLNFPRNTPVTLFASTFLIMAEMMRLRYTRLPLGGLQAGADGIGRRAFKIVFAMLVLGVIAIRTVQIFTVSQSIVITVYLVTISVMLGDILGVVLYFVSMVTNWTSLHEGHFASPQARLRSILDTMRVTTRSAIANSAVLALFVKSACTTTALVVIQAIVGFLEWIMCGTHCRLRSWGHPERRADDISLEEMPV